MQNHQELDTVWKLFNLLEKLSNILFDRYHDYLMERHLDEQDIINFENLFQDLIRIQSKQNENLRLFNPEINTVGLTKT